jgi:hypothetical protein
MLGKKNVFSEGMKLLDYNKEDSVLALKYITEYVTPTLLSQIKLFLNASIFIKYLDKFELRS